MKKIDPFSPLTVGNGELAFTADITGFQTFDYEYEKGMPLCTQSQWGWHSTPFSAKKHSIEEKELKPELHNNGRRQVPYATSSKGQKEAFNWLRQNPHRLHLGRIGLDISLQDGRKAQREAIEDIEQRLNLWEGILESSFSLEDQEVKTIACCHPERDLLAFWIKSDLLAAGKIKIAIDFPYGSPNKNAADWTKDEKHSTEVVKWNKNSLELMRILDEDKYFLQISFSKNGRVIRKGRNSFVIENTGEEGELDFTCSFTPVPGRGTIPSFYETAASSKKHWESFWMKGGAVELSESSDKRALELERRIVLSQYLTAIQCGGSLPPRKRDLPATAGTVNSILKCTGGTVPISLSGDG
jgi:protein-glucosylgalactosylhydroxylysine glucosidase